MRFWDPPLSWLPAVSIFLKFVVRSCLLTPLILIPVTRGKKIRWGEKKSNSIWCDSMIRQMMKSQPFIQFESGDLLLEDLLMEEDREICKKTKKISVLELTTTGIRRGSQSDQNQDNVFLKSIEMSHSKSIDGNRAWILGWPIGPYDSWYSLLDERREDDDQESRKNIRRIAGNGRKIVVGWGGWRCRKEIGSERFLMMIRWKRCDSRMEHRMCDDILASLISLQPFCQDRIRGEENFDQRDPTISACSLVFLSRGKRRRRMRSQPVKIWKKYYLERTGREREWNAIRVSEGDQ